MQAAKQPRIVFLEFNELCKDLLDRWMGEGKLPNFKRFFDASEVYTTYADETDPAYLEPWIQWYSIHTGLSYRQHKVFHLTDGPKAGHTDIWNILLENGKRVINCSSMNCKGFRAEGSVFLPDPWCTSEPATPDELQAFHRVVSTKVREYTNDRDCLTRKDYLAFLSLLLRRGLRSETVAAILGQLFKEKALRKDIAWKRAVLLDRLQLDLFRHYWRRLKPDFATFFLNSTAHYQHSYWRQMDPEAFTLRPSEAEREKYKDAIFFGYQNMDRVLGDLFALEKEGATLVLASALGQQPFLKREGQGGQHFYRPRNAQQMLKEFGIQCERLAPVMTHQYLATFSGEAEAAEARRRLEAVRYQGKPLFGYAPSDANAVYFGNQVFSEVGQEECVEVDGPQPRRIRFFDLFYKIEEVKSGCHHTDGILWLKTGRHRVVAEKVSILDILPTLLDLFSIQPRPEVASLWTGKSLYSAAEARPCLVT